MLPAVQAAREAARRAQCTNHLKQLALGLHNYHDVKKMFPINFYTVGGGVGSYKFCSWMTLVLPYIEQQALFDKIDWNLSTGDATTRYVNTDVAQTVVPTFLCPSDDNDDGTMLGLAYQITTPWAVTNYQANGGSNFNLNDLVCHHSWPRGRNANSEDWLTLGNGPIPRGSDNVIHVTRFRDVFDGTSNTFAVGEKVAKWSNRGGWWVFNATASCGCPLNYVPDIVRNNPNATLESIWDDYANGYRFHSRHPGGGNFALCDGSVKFISEGIDLFTYRMMGNMGDNEPITVP